ADWVSHGSSHSLLRRLIWHYCLSRRLSRSETTWGRSCSATLTRESSKRHLKAIRDGSTASNFSIPASNCSRQAMIPRFGYGMSKQEKQSESTSDTPALSMNYGSCRMGSDLSPVVRIERLGCGKSSHEDCSRAGSGPANFAD